MSWFRSSLFVAVVSTSMLFAAPASGALTLNVLEQTELMDFEDYAGNGLRPGGGDGTLDSNLWELALGEVDGGFQSISTNLGDTIGAGDFGRGVSAGGVAVRGAYAFEPETGNRALGVQVGSNGFATALATLHVRNETGHEVDVITVSFDAWVYNDSNGSNYFDLEFSQQGGFIDPAGLDTPTTADPVPGWGKVNVEYALLLPEVGTFGGTLLPLQNGDEMRIRFSVGGDSDAENRYDEVAIDNLRITAYSSTAIPEPSFGLLLALGASVWVVRRKDRT